MSRVLRQLTIATLLAVSASVTTVFAAAPTDTPQLLQSGEAAVSLDECSQVHAALLTDTKASKQLRQFARSGRADDCVLTMSMVKTKTKAGSATLDLLIQPAAATNYIWCGFYTGTEGMRGKFWPYPVVAVAYSQFQACGTFAPYTDNITDIPRGPWPWINTSYGASGGINWSATLQEHSYWAVVRTYWWMALWPGWFHFQHGWDTDINVFGQPHYANVF